MIFTFYKALGHDVGNSMVEDDIVPLAAELMKKAEAAGVQLVLPTDVVLADKFDEAAGTRVATVDDMAGEWMGLDIGPDSVAAFKEILKKSKTIVWNEPMGVFEMAPFATGTTAVADARGGHRQGDHYHRRGGRQRGGH